MRKERLTIEEVKEFNPTFDKPMICECDNGKWVDDMAVIKIIKVDSSGIITVNTRGEVSSQSAYTVDDYPSQKPETKIEVLYECVSDIGDLATYFGDGRYPIFSNKKKSISTYEDALKRKTGRTFKLDMNTWELIQDE